MLEHFVTKLVNSKKLKGKAKAIVATQSIESAINYLKLRKIKRLLLQNQADLEKADPSQEAHLFLTHQHLKQLEMELSKKLGSVVIR